jgi:hypothetical protein
MSTLHKLEHSQSCGLRPYSFGNAPLIKASTQGMRGSLEKTQARLVTDRKMASSWRLSGSLIQCELHERAGKDG